jgi:hypothetical protein
MNEEFATGTIRDTWSFDHYYNVVITMSDIIEVFGADLVRMVLLREMWAKFPTECAENGLTDLRNEPTE